MSISEDALQEAIIQRAQFEGWKVAHFRPAKTEKGWRTSVSADGKGFPDLVLVRERVIWVELKSMRGEMSVEQRLWRDWLLAAGQEWYCWTPLEWTSGVIDEILGVKLDRVEKPVESVDDPERATRILEACGGDVEQARRILGVLG